jgi:hypothetical protein
MIEQIEDLLTKIDSLPDDTGSSRRREELTERAAAAGHSREYADLIYDVATEEELDPVIAFEVVLARVGVRDLGESPIDHNEETQVESPPVWVEPLPTSDDAAREKNMRLTFRRLRSALADSPSRREALQRFARQPDVGVVDY